MPYRAAADEWFSELRDVDSRHHAGIHILLFQGVLQHDRIHHRCEHPDVIGSSAIHVSRGLRNTTKDVSAPAHDRNLNPYVVYGLDLSRNRLGHGDIDAVI